MTAAKFLMFAPLLMGVSAHAQEASPPPAQPPAADPQAAATPVSEEEVDRFALAALVLQQISADEALDQDQKQAAMVNAVQQTGLEPQRFNQIAQASQSDTDLQQRIELAANQHLQTAQENQ